MRRRQFIAGLGCAAEWPIVALAQQADRLRRVGVLLAGAENDSGSKVVLSGFTQELSH